MAQQLKSALVNIKSIAAAAGLAGIAIGASNSIYNVDAGHRAIIFSRFGGIQDNIYSEGWHFRIPLIQYPKIFDIRAKPRQITSITGSKDLQMVNLKLRILTRADPTRLPLIYCMLGQDFEERVLPSICLEVLNAVVAKFDASQLITKRHEVSLLVREQLTQRARNFNIIFEDVSITDLSFGRQYTAAIEAKQVAQQEAQRASFEVEKAKQEKQRKILQAEGEAQAAKMLNEAISKNPGYLRLRKIQAARQVAKTMANSQNTVFLDSASLMLNIADKDFDVTNASINH